MGREEAFTCGGVEAMSRASKMIAFLASDSRLSSRFDRKLYAGRIDSLDLFNNAAIFRVDRMRRAQLFCKVQALLADINCDNGAAVGNSGCHDSREADRPCARYGNRIASLRLQRVEYGSSTSLKATANGARFRKGRDLSMTTALGSVAMACVANDD